MCRGGFPLPGKSKKSKSTWQEGFHLPSTSKKSKSTWQEGFHLPSTSKSQKQQIDVVRRISRPQLVEKVEFDVTRRTSPPGTSKKQKLTQRGGFPSPPHWKHWISVSRRVTPPQWRDQPLAVLVFLRNYCIWGDFTFSAMVTSGRAWSIGTSIVFWGNHMNVWYWAG